MIEITNIAKLFLIQNYLNVRIMIKAGFEIMNDEWGLCSYNSNLNESSKVSVMIFLAPKTPIDLYCPPFLHYVIILMKTSKQMH